MGWAHYAVAPVRVVWKSMPAWMKDTHVMQSLGRAIHSEISRRDRLSEGCCPCSFTRFLRNKALLDVLVETIKPMPGAAEISILSLGCSTGAELYSLLWRLRTTYPALRVSGWGVDLSPEVIAKAERGRYRRSDEELSWLTPDERQSLFDETDEVCLVQSFVKAATTWFVADALNPNLVAKVGSHDVVLANNFLGPLPGAVADAGLNNISKLVKPSGYLVLCGVDLNVRELWVHRNAYRPLHDHIAEVHFGDRSATDWPWTRWSAEPIDKMRPHWEYRYACVFQKPASRGGKDLMSAPAAHE